MSNEQIIGRAYELTEKKETKGWLISCVLGAVFLEYRASFSGIFAAKPALNE